jgi:hypothetical protein
VAEAEVNMAAIRHFRRNMKPLLKQEGSPDS